MVTATVLAVDIGGTKVATAVISSDGEILRTSTAPTILGDPAKLVDQIVSMLGANLAIIGRRTSGVLGLGVGVPAVIDAEHKIILWAPNLPGCENFSLHDALAQRLDLPVRIEYDGHTAVLGEWWSGAGRGYQNVVSVVIGTGIGGGIVMDGRLCRGASSLAGAVGWFVLGTEPPPEEHALRLGHWESLAAGPGIARLAHEMLCRDDRPSLLRGTLSSPAGLTAQAIFDAARQGDPLAREITDRIGQLLGVGIANIVSLLNPDVVVLGGGVGAQAALIIEQIRAIVDATAQPVSARAVRIVPSLLGARAGLLGAAKALLLSCGYGSRPGDKEVRSKEE